MPTYYPRDWEEDEDGEPWWVELLAWMIPAAVAVWTVLMILFWGEE